jgi:folate-binding protein YgfZ
MENTKLSESIAPGARRADTATEREYEALTRGAAFRVLNDRVVFRMIGDDRVSFLHGMCSNDVKNLRAGGILYALFLTEHAHVIADFYAWATDDAILIESDRALWAHAREHLDRLIVADDVEMEEQDGLAVIDIEGPASPEVIAKAFGDAAKLDVWRYVAHGEIRIGRVPRVGPPGFAILVAKAKAPEIVAKFGGAVAVGAAALETVRIEHGIPRVGVDTGEKTIALEARLEPAISSNKGCYLGQETIERAAARGGLKKRLFGLRFEGSSAPVIGAAIHLDGKEVGHVSSAAMSPKLGPIALSILHHSAWTVGTAVEVEGGLKASVSDLPFS